MATAIARNERKRGFGKMGRLIVRHARCRLWTVVYYGARAGNSHSVGPY